MQIILWNDDQGRVVALTPPGGMTVEEAKKNGALVPQDRPSFIVDNATLPGVALHLWRLSPSGGVTTVVPPPPIDQSDLDTIAKRDKAILLAAAAMAGRTPAQAKAAFKTAWDALP